ncbi:MAG: twin-arginine translocase subunit TatC [Cyclobacteriaceae bacterium]|jgi:sec-independent protein translocase protein TatC|nr:twin-arginine translocase subunit TatC [Cyclobacteriaceae bacterium]
MPLDQPDDYPEEKEMSFLDHLEELRWHIVKSVAAILIFMIVSFFFTQWIFHNIIFAPTRIDFPTFQLLCKLGEATGAEEALCAKPFPFKVQSRFMTGQFTMQLTTAFVLGFVLAFPYVFWQIWSFIKPGLRFKEKKSSRGAVFAVSSLFIIGVLFGYFVMCPLAIWFLSTYSISPVISNEFDITSVVSTMVALVFGSGLLFQLPVVVYFLTKIGMITPQFMRKNRKYALIGILVLGAIVTPPDPLSQSLISLPLYLLYEVSIFISAGVIRRKEKEEAAAA